MEATDYWITRLALQRGLAFIYLIAFLVALNQFRPLCGERGLLPAPDYLKRMGFRNTPSLFHFFPTDRAFAFFSWTGLVLSILALAGVTDSFGPLVSMTAWVLLWAIYLSFVNAGQTFYGFGWESILLESGFLAVFLGSAEIEPPAVVIWLFRWVLFRVMFGAGMIKWRGDPCWKDLTCLDYHFETQPMPNPLSRLFHLMPERVHRIGVAFNHVAELPVPFFYFLPQPVSGTAGVITILFLFSIIVSGNFSWLNWMTVVLAFATVDLSFLSHFVTLSPPPLLPLPVPLQVATWALALMVGVKSIPPVRNMFSSAQVMNTSFDPLHLVNTYGAFGSITRERYEIVLEGAEENAGPATQWKEYEFKGKPGEVHRVPRQFAPYHLRLDWLMWFAAMPSRYAPLWLMRLVVRLLEGDKATLALLAENPFPDKPPQVIRAQYYSYRFTTKEEKKRTGAVWHRELVSEYFPPMSLKSQLLRKFIKV